MSQSSQLLQEPNLANDFILQVLKNINNKSGETPQTIWQIVATLQKILLSYVKLDNVSNPSALFESKYSLTTAAIELLEDLIPNNIRLALVLRTKNNIYIVSPEEFKPLSKHIDRKIVAYLLIRNHITKISSPHDLVTFKKFLLSINDSGLEKKGRAITNNMGKTIHNLLAYLNKLESSTLKLDIIEATIRISDTTLHSFLKNFMKSTQDRILELEYHINRIPNGILKVNNEIIELTEKRNQLIVRFENSEREANLRLQESKKNKEDIEQKNKSSDNNNETDELISKLNQATHLVTSSLQFLDSIKNAKRDEMKSISTSIQINTEKLNEYHQIQIEYHEYLLFQKQSKETLKIYLEHFTHLESMYQAYCNFNTEKSVIEKFGTMLNSLRNFRDLIRNILNAIYYNPSTKDHLNPILEAYNHETQMACLVSCFSEIPLDTNTLTNPSLINIVLDYLMTSNLTHEGTPDIEAFDRETQMASLSECFGCATPLPDILDSAADSKAHNDQPKVRNLGIFSFTPITSTIQQYLETGLLTNKP